MGGGVITGGGVLIGKMRPEVVAGAWIQDFVSNQAPALMGGAWLDAPDYVAAGSTCRDEVWNGTVGTAYATARQAARS